MFYGSYKNTVVAATALVVGLGFSAISFADGFHRSGDVNLAINPDTTVLYLKSDIYQGGMDPRNGVGPFDCVDAGGAASPCILSDGTPWVGVGFPVNVGTIHWQYTGNVYAAKVDDDTGVQKGLGDKVGTVAGNPSFPGQFGYLAFYDVPTVVGMVGETLPWTCDNCDLRVSGSTFAKIDDMPLTGRAFIGLGTVGNPEGYLGLRMAGCTGIKETSGQGKYANMQGTACLNGTIGFQPDFSGVGTSNCVLVLKDGPYVDAPAPAPAP